MNYSNLDEFTQSYIETALWSSTDESDESGGLPMDENYGSEDIAGEALAQMIKDCQNFREYAFDQLESCNLDAARQGQDFWLTRNGHGAGFWDEGLGALGEILSKKAKSFGSCDLYIGDDGLIYCT